MPTINCPECSEQVFVDAESEQGDVVACDECGASLIVVGLDPFELDLRSEEDDDGIDVDDDIDEYSYRGGDY
jgi:alpha-aminoadipate carrier protein LysW